MNKNNDIGWFILCVLSFILGSMFMAEQCNAAPLSTLQEKYILHDETIKIYEKYNNGNRPSYDLRGLYVPQESTAYYTQYFDKYSRYHERMYHLQKDFAAKEDYALFYDKDCTEYMCSPLEEMAQEYAVYKVTQEEGGDVFAFLYTEMPMKQKVVELQKILFFMRAEGQ
jgi:hypothetical protein